MKKRPNPFWHMMAWGLSSGTILAISYIVILVDFFEGGTIDSLFSLINPGIWYLAFIFGGVPGAIMGFFLALALWGILRKVPIPFTKDDMKQKRVAVYGWTFSITIFLSFIMISIFLGGLFDTLILAPPFIAAIAATYVAHRYMYRLRLWSGGMESRKSKAKNEVLAASRLVDNPPESLHSDDMIDGNQSYSEKNL